jgi:hypothetical protein
MSRGVPSRPAMCRRVLPCAVTSRCISVAPLNVWDDSLQVRLSSPLVRSTISVYVGTISIPLCPLCYMFMLIIPNIHCLSNSVACTF